MTGYPACSINWEIVHAGYLKDLVGDPAVRTRYYMAIIIVLAVMVVLLSNMALGYASFQYVMPSPEENATHSYRLLICEAQ